MRIVDDRQKGIMVSEIEVGQMFRLFGDDYSIYVMTCHRDMVNIGNGDICDSADYDDELAELLENVDLVLR